MTNSYGPLTNVGTSLLSPSVSKSSTPQNHDVIKGLWKRLVPHRIEVFTWTTLLNCINTRYKLLKMGLIAESEDLCTFCNHSSEQYDHIFLHYQFSRQLWEWWLELWNVKWVFPSRLRDLFDQWHIATKNGFFKKVWSVIWSLWKERNARVFNYVSSSLANL